MSDGNTRRNQKRKKASTRYKIRYDRIAAAVLAIAAVSVVGSSLISGLSGKHTSETSEIVPTAATEMPSQSTVVDNLAPKDENAAGIIQTQPTETGTDVSKYSSEVHSNDDIHKGDLVLINSEHAYTFPEGDVELTTLFDHIDTASYNVCDLVTKLDGKVIQQLNGLMKGFIEQGNDNDITVIGGYRTLEEQNDKYNSGQSRFQGGCNDYHSARTFDIGIFPKDQSSSGYYSSVGNYSWIDENAADFGFIVRFPEGKDDITKELARTYTFRYVGVPHSVYIKQNNLCLEEYIDLLKTHNSSDPLEIAVGKELYNVYYVPASSGSSTEVPVPTDKTYTVSGDNAGGFIVSALMN